MKSFAAWSIFVMTSLIALVYLKVCNSPDSGLEENDLSVKMGNLHFTTTMSTDDISLVTAEFDLESESRESGEIQIIVDGRMEVNNRLLIKKGASHYSVDFMLNYRGISKDQYLHSAMVRLIVNGETADVINQDFRKGNTLPGSLMHAGLRFSEIPGNPVLHSTKRRHYGI